MTEPSWQIVKPEGCICPVFRDVVPYRIADLGCPVHGVESDTPGDGFWKMKEVKPDDRE